MQQWTQITWCLSRTLHSRTFVTSGTLVTANQSQTDSFFKILIEAMVLRDGYDGYGYDFLSYKFSSRRCLNVYKVCREVDLEQPLWGKMQKS